MTHRPRLARVIALLVCAMLSACKQDLLRDLPETEANEMIALLAVSGIEASKTLQKGSKVTLSVDGRDFGLAVEMLRQGGFPRRATLSDQLSQASQLVSSPLHERARLNYLKERRLEEILSHLNGVVYVGVAIADAEDVTAGPRADTRVRGGGSAAVFIQHAPHVNVALIEPQIRSFIANGIPNMHFDDVSVVMQAMAPRLPPGKEQDGGAH
jgi:type III secretion protein J